MRYLILVVVTMVVCGCQPAEVEMENADGSINAFGDSSGGYNETNYSVCNSGSASSIAAANWGVQTRTAEGVQETTELYVSIQGQASFHKRCVYNGRSTIINGKVPAVFSNTIDGSKGVLDFSGGVNEQSEIGESAKKLSCRLRVESGRLNYQFNGRCLELSRPGNSNSPKVVMVPY